MSDEKKETDEEALTCPSCGKPRCDLEAPLKKYPETDGDLHHMDYFCHGDCEERAASDGKKE